MEYMEQQAQMALEGAIESERDQWRYMDCDYAASGSAVLALGAATGHFWTPIAMCQDKDVAQHIAAVLKLRGKVE